ncbi:MAG: response regulator transcription factor [Clostridia bacterium]|nr:response regulator transcription factor [Clostridia bacterium]
MIKVLIVEDQIVLRESIKFRLNSDDEIKVVGCAGNGREALDLCGKWEPDVVLMDIMMPGCDGIEATKLIKANYNFIKIIILTIFIDNENIKKAMKNGADGYVLKDVAPEELISIIKNTYKGMRTVHQNVYNAILSEFISHNTVEVKNDFGLSEKEIEIIKLIVEGKSTKELSKEVFLSEGRVRNVISGILTKLNLKDRVQLTIFALKNNIV